MLAGFNMWKNIPSKDAMLTKQSGFCLDKFSAILKAWRSPVQKNGRVNDSPFRRLVTDKDAWIEFFMCGCYVLEYTVSKKAPDKPRLFL